MSPTTSQRLGRILTSLRRARNGTERLLKSKHSLSDEMRKALWGELESLEAKCIMFATRLRTVIEDETKAAHRRAA